MSVTTELSVASSDCTDRCRHEPDSRLPIWKRGTNVGQGAVMLAGLGVGLVAAHALSIPTPSCPVRTLTGVPCPFCGMTHLATDLFSGRIGTVLGHDPAGLALAAILAVVVVVQLSAMARGTHGPRFVAAPLLGIVVIGLIALHWGTTIVTGGLLNV